MTHGFSAIPLTDMFQIDTTGRIRGHSLKLVQEGYWKVFLLSSSGVQVEYAG